jgi:Fe2+ transport system protein FeoA
MTLASAPAGQRVRIVRGGGLALAGIGLHPGDDAVVLRSAPFRGPLLVEVRHSGVRIAVARGRASAILVEPAGDP